jgi:tripartite-type tricarboxylate transporter receptor subunit TctC
MRSRGIGSIYVLAIAVGTGLFASGRPAAAADYPSRPIDLYIGSAPAGSTDVLGRVLAKSLEDVLGQPIVVQNTPGAGGAVMATKLMHSAPDGYSLGMTISHAYSGNPVVTPAATPYTVDDFTHLASVSKGQCALVTNSNSPYEGLNDLVEPVFASQSALTRIVPDYIAKVANVKFRVITVQGGGEMMQTILGGHADFGFSGGPHVDHVASGQMRVLASVEDSRLATSPEVPTLRELGYDISACALFVVSAPPNLPDDIKHTLAAALKEAIGSPEMKALILNLKYPEYFLGPEEVTQALQDEAATLARAVARIDAVASTTESGELPSSFMPYVSAALGLGALALMLIARLTRSTRDGDSVQLTKENWIFICTAAGVLSVSFNLIDRFGYLPGAMALVAGFMALARAKLKVIVGTAILFPIALWLLFDKLLGFPLP